MLWIAVEAFRGDNDGEGCLGFISRLCMLWAGRQAVVVSAERSQAVNVAVESEWARSKRVARMTRRGPHHWLAHGGFCKACSSPEKYW